jgi:heterodisulfide reductase subunit A
LCAEKCPKRLPDDFNQGLDKKKAAFIKYSQAVPLKYAIDDKECIYFTRGRCRACEKFCPSEAINFDEQKKDMTLEVGTIILAAGFDPYEPAALDTYGYSSHPNILTALEFERVLSATGPYQGHVVRPSDDKPPKKIAWLQCVGSRDEHEGAKSYCSSVCCTYAVKEAVMAKEHVPGLDAAIFYMDIRTHGKDFERYYNRAKDVTGVRFIKSRIASLRPIKETDTLSLGYTDETGKRFDEEFDIVVLSVGMCVSQDARETAELIGVDLDADGFPVGNSFKPVETSIPGVLVCGALESPKDIPSSVMDASAAAGVAGSFLNEARHSLQRTKTKPEQKDVSGDSPRIGVFVCSCGTNIAGVVDVENVVEFARGLPFVVHVENNLFTCSPDSVEHIAQVIEEQDLNRVVVAACTPRTHEPTFQDALANAGLNKHLFEMANIRNHCSWVHSAEPEAATAKSKDLVRSAVAKASHLRPLSEEELEINHEALVVGGGLAGMTAARNLSQQGFKTYLVERSDSLGGQAKNIRETWKGEDVQSYLAGLIEEVEADELIEVCLESEVKEVEGSIGVFQTTISVEGEDRVIEHGVAILSTGASELKPDGYLYGKDDRVLTGLDLNRRLMEDPDSLAEVKSAVFVQCVGSRIPERPYCSKVCCTQSVVNALKLLEINPDMDVYIVYRDMRTYGLREALYREARLKGVHFVRHVLDEGLTVQPSGDDLSVLFTDYVLNRKLKLKSQMVVLAAAMVTPKGEATPQIFKVPVNEDGFYVEAHAKLRPVDFATDGVFVCGLAHGPKPVDETIAQAQAAAARAVTILSSETTTVGGVVAEINLARCTGCAVCVAACPYQAMSLNEDDKATVNESLCKGCGTCASACRSGAASLRGFTNAAIFSQILAS